MTRYNPPEETTKMQLIFSDDSLPTNVTQSIFLAGPSPRYKEGDVIGREWRHDAIDYLKSIGYTGTVFVPLYRKWFQGVDTTITGEAPKDYNSQIEWEDAAMSRADVLLFWVPRTETMRGMTTNIEFGRYLDSGRLVFGYPEDAVNMDYMTEQAAKQNLPVVHSLPEVIDNALTRLGDGAYREGDQVLVPLVIWQSAQFQVWYQNTIADRGNRLDGFTVKSIISFNHGRNLFGFAAHVSVWLTTEDRHKSNEWIFSRTSTSYVVPHYKDESGQHHFVLVREFRSPVNNRFGYVFELPGGSSAEDCDVIENAQKELHEETGLEVTDLGRFKLLGNRQTFSTFSTNQIVACGLALTQAEFEQLQQAAQDETVFGENDGERIILKVVTLDELLSSEGPVEVDYSTLGMVMLALKS